MSINHHPSEELLLDYATGALSEAWSLAIATHLALCPECRRTVASMEAVGGSILETALPEPVASGSFDAVLAQLDNVEPEPALAMPPVLTQTDSALPVLPEPLRSYVGGDIEDLKWQRLGLGAYQLPIATGDNGVTARLLRIPAGQPVPEHSHNGLELTLVLSGAFSDTTGRYGRGDLQEADEDLEHRPHAAPGGDCICLAVTDAPLKFKDLTARVLQPLLGI